MKKILLLLIFFSQICFGQISLIDQYQFNLQALNPAFAGERGNFGFSAMLGLQFAGNYIPNQTSQIIALDGKLGESNSSMGFQGFRNTVAGYKDDGLSLTYSYSLELDNVRIGLGANGGFSVSPSYVGSPSAFQSVSPFGGLGVSLFMQDAFLSLASPTLFAKSNSINGITKPVNFLGGYRYGTYEDFAINFSVMAAFDVKGEASTLFHLNPKLWWRNKIGLGGSFRFKENESMKIVSTLEIRIGETSTVGISYDPIPLNIYNSDPNLINPNGIFQVMYRYDGFLRGTKSPFLNQF